MGSDQHARVSCIDLWRRFGHEYQVTIDPAYDAKGVRRDRLDPWYFVMLCKFGTIWPYGGDYLAVDVDHHPMAARKVSSLPLVSVLCDGDQEKTFLFPVSMFDQVAQAVRPRRRRKLSEEQRQACAARLRHRKRLVNQDG